MSSKRISNQLTAAGNTHFSAYINCALISLLISLLLLPIVEARITPLYFVAFLTIAGGLAGISRLRPLFFCMACMIGVLYALVALTPLVKNSAHYFVTKEALPATADAVVVLSAEWPLQNRIKSQGLERLIHGLRIAKQNIVSNLVITDQPWFRGNPQKDLSELLDQLEKITIKIGPVENTYDEARAFNHLARQRNWRRIILVTSALHSRRAKAIFAEQNPGIEIISSPADAREFDLEILVSSYEKLKAARLMCYEAGAWTKNLILGRL